MKETLKAVMFREYMYNIILIYRDRTHHNHCSSPANAAVHSAILLLFRCC